MLPSQCYHPNNTVSTLLSGSYCPNATILMLPSQCYHLDATIATLLSSRCWPNATFLMLHGITLMLPIWRCRPDGAVIIMPFCWCHSHALVLTVPSRCCCPNAAILQCRPDRVTCPTVPMLMSSCCHLVLPTWCCCLENAILKLLSWFKMLEKQNNIMMQYTTTMDNITTCLSPSYMFSPHIDSFPGLTGSQS